MSTNLRCEGALKLTWSTLFSIFLFLFLFLAVPVHAEPIKMCPGPSPWIVDATVSRGCSIRVGAPFEEVVGFDADKFVVTAVGDPSTPIAHSPSWFERYTAVHTERASCEVGPTEREVVYRLYLLSPDLSFWPDVEVLAVTYDGAPVGTIALLHPDVSCNNGLVVGDDFPTECDQCEPVTPSEPGPETPPEESPEPDAEAEAEAASEVVPARDDGCNASPATAVLSLVFAMLVRGRCLIRIGRS